MGGKNPLVVMNDADIAAAAESAAIAAFSCAGQWCISTSRALVHKSVMKEFLVLLQKHIAKIVVGDGADPKTTMGPVCGKSQLEGVLAGIEKAKAEGATLFCGGSRITANGMENGCFVQPTVFINVTPEMSVAQEEIFGPVLAVMEFDDFDKAIEIANGVQFGLGSSIYTKDLKKAMEFVNRSEVGLTHVNMHTAYKEPQLSFGGVKLSGHGVPEAGKTGIEFFTEHKTIYIKPM
jgi:aldehyde dehydrogenase (NAD+)